ncbi:hypothetical protein TetV_590 [Tetraselmis virus 1]|uniref:Uncharacterized protein n=1 Tax=Tetraselmis virus 1 TaxID=2060617 RepID=A0A2P0VP78_9VIRU|nr:hypothetical protein QJ968_gp464 [Tetraselmis virus 1]AUF82672.1 hypothetical protein TetV_590 [Tetraselmis virus 1]
MNPKNVVLLLNRSKEPLSSKVEYLCNAVERYNLIFSVDQLFGMRLDHKSIIRVSRLCNTEVSIDDFMKYKMRISSFEFQKYSDVIKYDKKTILKNFSFCSDRMEIVKHLNLVYDINDYLNDSIIFYTLSRLSPRYLSRNPTRDEIKVVSKNYKAGIQTYVQIMRNFGYEPTFEEAMFVSEYFDLFYTYKELESCNIPITDIDLFIDGGSIKSMIRHMWKEGSEYLYNYSDFLLFTEREKVDWMKAKRSIRIIQKFLRLGIKIKKAIIIQRRWRQCFYSPHHEIGKRRLLREAHDAVDGDTDELVESLRRTKKRKMSFKLQISNKKVMSSRTFKTAKKKQNPSQNMYAIISKGDSEIIDLTNDD